ncbi:MFS transporter [Anaerobacillus isosaccharinicus]|uniref:MFS transporter n=1 Tax=Anaerobacillus isosaccharinicus TaxID=1532552 RepID=A0A1S2MHG5_9BACI|nr:MFS transporter [Anaerobacillus isosaccharinicus]MBA5586463.1 MFS transporter [Anaerobacillus isosaccharinicus]QOY35294.1 MFS transporter [Anaerobacillus isosaccharinicus]
MSNKLWKNKNFVLLWSGQTVSKLGDRLFQIALLWFIYTETGSSLALGISLICFTIPMIVIQPMAGIFADRNFKKQIIVTSDFLNGILMLTIAYFLFAGQLPITVLYGLIALSSGITAFFTPAIQASIPLLVEEEQLPKANSLNQFSMQMSNILGPVLAGIVLGMTEIWFLLLLNGISYVISALTECWIKIPAVKSETENASFNNRFKEGFKYLMKNNQLLYLVFVGGVIINFFLAPLQVFLTVLSNDILHVGSTGFGLINTSISVGAIVGVLLVFLNVCKDKYKMVVIGLTLEGVSLLLLGIIPTFSIAIISSIILGLGVALASTGIGTLYQTIIPKDKMGRVMGLVSTILLTVVPIGTLFGSFIINYFAVYHILIVFGVIVILASLSLIFLLVKLSINKESNVQIEA